MNTAAKHSTTFLQSLSGAWLCGVCVILVGLAMEIYLAAEVARKDTAPVARMVSSWLWIASPYLAILTASFGFRKWPRSIAVLAAGSVLCTLLGYAIVWMDQQSAGRPGGMNPIGGGGASMLSLLVAGVFQWMLFVFILCVTVLVTTLGPKSKPAS